MVHVKLKVDGTCENKFYRISNVSEISMSNVMLIRRIMGSFELACIKVNFSKTVVVLLRSTSLKLLKW